MRMSEKSHTNNNNNNHNHNNSDNPMTSRRTDGGKKHEASSVSGIKTPAAFSKIISSNLKHSLEYPRLNNPQYEGIF